MKSRLKNNLNEEQPKIVLADNLSNASDEDDRVYAVVDGDLDRAQSTASSRSASEEDEDNLYAVVDKLESVQSADSNNLGSPSGQDDRVYAVLDREPERAQSADSDSLDDASGCDDYDSLYAMVDEDYTQLNSRFSASRQSDSSSEYASLNVRSKNIQSTSQGLETFASSAVISSNKLRPSGALPKSPVPLPRSVTSSKPSLPQQSTPMSSPKPLKPPRKNQPTAAIGCDSDDKTNASATLPLRKPLKPPRKNQPTAAIVGGGFDDTTNVSATLPLRKPLKPPRKNQPTAAIVGGGFDDTTNVSATLPLRKPLKPPRKNQPTTATGDDSDDKTSASATLPLRKPLKPPLLPRKKQPTAAIGGDSEDKTNDSAFTWPRSAPSLGSYEGILGNDPERPPAPFPHSQKSPEKSLPPLPSPSPSKWQFWRKPRAESNPEQSTAQQNLNRNKPRTVSDSDAQDSTAKQNKNLGKPRRRKMTP